MDTSIMTRPDTEYIVQTTKAAYDSHARAWAERPFTPSPLILEFVKQFIEALPDTEHRVLDLGCGPGRWTKYLLDAGVPSVVGLDISANMLQIAKKTAPQASYVQADIRQGHELFQPESVSGILAMASLLHLPKASVKEALIGYRRVMIAGGVLAIMVKWGVADGFEKTPDMPQRYVSYLRAAELEQAVMDAGYGNIQVGEIQDSQARIWIGLLASPHYRRSDNRSHSSGRSARCTEHADAGDR